MNLFKTLLIISLGLIGLMAKSQNLSEFKKALIEVHSEDDIPTILIDSIGVETYREILYERREQNGGYVFNEESDEIIPIDLAFFKDYDVETYLVDMTFYLGHHIHEVKCIFIFYP